MRVRGIKHGKTIELLEALQDVPDGVEVTVELRVDSNQSPQAHEGAAEQDKLARLNELFGAWSNQPDLDEAFVDIDRQRHDYRGRVLHRPED
ncbi:MAG: hypothetical protein AAGA75_25475 [Cyanobacteria bacterium P01_E01_bin.6]